MLQDVSKLKDLSMLLVDDEAFILETLSHFLKRRAKHVATAENGREALKLLESETFDFIISDIEMPEMNGYELHEVVRKKHPDVQFIFLSGHTSGDVRPEHEPRTLFKPIDKDDLLNKIISYL